jgi:hypothetical protein
LDKLPEVWIIRNKITGEHWRAKSGKSSWKAQGHAKNAWANSYNNLSWYSYQDIVIRTCTELGVGKVFDRMCEEVNCYRVPYFDEQDVYEVVKLNHKSEDQLKVAIEYLKELSTFGDPENEYLDMNDLHYLISVVNEFLETVENK